VPQEPVSYVNFKVSYPNPSTEVNVGEQQVDPDVVMSIK